MSPRASLSFPVEEASQVGEARRAVGTLARLLGFDETRQGNLAIIVTEIANNILRHAGRGEILLRAVETGDAIPGVEILALDKGPGMADVSRCLEDGFSTGGTSGTGLGAVRRLAASLDIYSVVGRGTVLLCYLWADQAGGESPVTVGAVNRPKPGQEACGDHWAAAHVDRRHVFMVADGLGHGPEAAQAGQSAVRAFHKHVHARPSGILEAVHAALHGTRGAAVAVVDVDEDTRTVCFVGVGNIAGEIMNDVSSSMMSYHGIVGYQMRKVQEMTYLYTPGALLLLSSDGIATLGPLSAYPALLVQQPAIIAGVLYRDFQRTNDDATVVIARIQTETGGLL
ncbi:MAG: ATP-binding protein [Akkermansiaceae bacterium]|nr:ATP-binding protein [Armatimonadota bacterium]